MVDFSPMALQALDEGFTERQIADFLAQREGLDPEVARKEGIPDAAIINYLDPPEPPPGPKEDPGIGTRLKLNVREGFNETLAGEVVNRIESGQISKEEATALRRSIDEAKAAGSKEALPVFMPTEEEKRRRAANPMLRTPGKPNPYAGLSIEQLEEQYSQATQVAERKSGEFKEMRDRQKAEEAALPPWTEQKGLGGKLLHGGVALAGQLVGGAPSPENLIGGPGTGIARRAGEGALAYGARHLGGGAVEGALGAAVANPVVQTGRIERGEQKDFSVAEGAENVVLGAGVGATFRGVGLGVRRLMNRTPEADAKPVLDQPDVDSAIRAAREVVTGEDIAALQREGASDPLYGQTRDQASVLGLFSGFGDGVIVRDEGTTNYYLRKPVDGQETDVPLRVWDPLVGGEGTIPPDLVAAQRDVYGRQGLNVVYFEHQPGIDINGVFDPKRPDMLFLSNNPSRNVAEIGGHEVGHAMESVKFPDGTDMFDQLFRVMGENVTPEGVQHAQNRFMKTAPSRNDYADGAEGTELYTEAVTRHLIRELGADTHGEALAFPDYIGRVVDKVEQRYGPQTAREALQKFMDGIRQAMERLRQFFVGDAGLDANGKPLLGPAQTVSQTWFKNLGEVHNVLAQMDAAKFGETAGLRDRQGMLALPAPALVTPPRPQLMDFDGQSALGRESPLQSAPPTVRFYTGGDRSADGRQPWLTPDLREARMAAERNGEPVRYVDLSPDNPLIQRAWDGPDAPAMNFGAPPRVVSQFRDLEPATSPKPQAPLVPDTRTPEEALAAHEALRADTLRREAPRAEVPADFVPSRDEWTQAVRLSRGWDPQAALRNPMSLVTFVRRNGGITRESPEGQDLAAAGLARHPGLLRNRGVQADWMAQAAMDAGYELPMTKTGSGVDVNGFIEAVQADASGKQRLYPARTGDGLFDQPDQAKAMRDHLADIGLNPKGMPPQQIAWILRQDPDAARTIALGKLVHDVDPEGVRSLELADRLDREIERAQAETGNPEPGVWDMGDHRDLEAPTRQDLERYYAEYERATSPADLGRPAEARAAGDGIAEAPRVVEPGAAQDRQPEATGLGADRLAQEVPGVEQAAGGGREAGEGASLGGLIRAEVQKAGLEPDLRRFAAGEEPTPALLDVIQRTRGQMAEGPAFSPRDPQRPSLSPRDDATKPAFAPREPRIYGEKNEDAPYTPEQRQTMLNIGHAREAPPTLKESTKTAWRDRGTLVQRAKESLAYNVVDPYVALKRLGDDDISYKKARMANDSSGAFKQFMEHGPIEFVEDGGGYKNKSDTDTGGVMWNVVTPLMNQETGKTEAIRFIRWMAGGRAEGLRAEGREHRISRTDELQLKSLSAGDLGFDYPKQDGTTTRNRLEAFKDTQAKFNEANRNVLELTYQSGRIDKVLYDKLKADPWWVSFLREKPDGTMVVQGNSGGLAKQGGLKKLTGGSEKLGADMWGNTIETWGTMIDAAIKNKTARENLSVMESAGVARKIKEQDFNNLTNEERLDTTWVMADGKKQYWEVDDKGMLRALEGFRAANLLGKADDVIGAARRWFQYSIMANPVAQLKVLIKDQIHTPAVTGVGMNVAKNFYKGVSNLDTMTPLANFGRALAGEQLTSMVARPLGLNDQVIQRQILSADEMRLLSGGGLMSRSSSADSGIAPTSIGAFIRTPQALDTVMKYFGRLNTAYQQLATVGEGVSRMAVFQEMKKQKLPEWIAVYEARDVQDYSLRAGNPYIRSFVNMLPFANVHNIGLYKLARPHSVGSLATVFAAMTMLRVANDWFYQDDDEFQKRPELERNGNFWVKLGGVGINIPNGFEVGALSAMSGNFITAMFDPEMTLGRAARNAGRIAVDQLAMNPLPQVVRPVVEVAMNRQGGFIFGDRPIENRSDQRLDPEQRFNARTSMAARGMSGIFNTLGMGLSPKQIDHMWNQYTGWLGVQSMALADIVMRSASGEPTRPDVDVWNKYSGGAIRTETANQSRYVDMLYQQGEKIEHAYNTYKELITRGDRAGAAEYLADNREEIGKYRQFSRVKDVEGKLNRQIKIVENSQEMTADQKKLAIARISNQKHEAAKSVFVRPSP